MSLEEDIESEGLIKVLTKIHECKEEELQLRVDELWDLKVVKNKIINKLMDENDKIQLENETYRFIAGTLENPQAISNIKEENTRLIKENNEMRSILIICAATIKGLNERPEKLDHLWPRA